jgi:hypothetical protein
MLEKPDIADAKLLPALERHYRLGVRWLEFLPVGYDSRAWAYRVEAQEGEVYFLKLHREEEMPQVWIPPGVLVPRALKDLGLEQVVAALPDAEGGLIQRLDGFWLAIYPYIEGESGMQKGLSQAQWVEYGAFLRQLHAAYLPDDLKEVIPVRRSSQPGQDGTPDPVWTAQDCIASTIAIEPGSLLAGAGGRDQRLMVQRTEGLGKHSRTGNWISSPATPTFTPPTCW